MAKFFEAHLQKSILREALGQFINCAQGKLAELEFSKDRVEDLSVVIQEVSLWRERD
jgi:hypothetical protein